MNHVELAASTDGAWHHYCVDYDGSDWGLYFDGALTASGTDALAGEGTSPFNVKREKRGG